MVKILSETIESHVVKKCLKWLEKDLENYFKEGYELISHTTVNVGYALIHTIILVKKENNERIK